MVLSRVLVWHPADFIETECPHSRYTNLKKGVKKCLKEI